MVRESFGDTDCNNRARSLESPDDSSVQFSRIPGWPMPGTPCDCGPNDSPPGIVLSIS